MDNIAYNWDCTFYYYYEFELYNLEKRNTQDVIIFIFKNFEK